MSSEFRSNRAAHPEPLKQRSLWRPSYRRPGGRERWARRLAISQENAMKIRSLVAAASIGFMFLLVQGPKAEAAEIKVLSAIGMQAVMEDLGPKFERATGHKLAITFDLLGGVVKRVQGGETTDVVVIPRQGIDGFVKEGKVAADNVTVIARSGLGVAVRQGAPKPDIASPDALK